MKNLAQTIRTARLAQGHTLATLAAAAGCSRAYLCEIENNRHPNPPSRTLLAAIESALKLQTDSLTTFADWHATPPAVKQQLQHLTRQLQTARRNPNGSINLDALLANTSTNQPNAQQIHTANLKPVTHSSQQIPLINKVAAGYPTDFTDLDFPARFADEYVTCPTVNDPDAFAARVVGDSMSPQYHEGDIVIFSPSTDPTPGSDCFARLLPDHQITFKRAFFQTDHHIKLQPLNDTYPTRIIHRDEIDGLYPAVLRIQPIRPHSATPG